MDKVPKYKETCLSRNRKNVWLQKDGGGGDKVGKIWQGRMLRPFLGIAKTHMENSSGRGIHRSTEVGIHMSSEYGAGILHRTTF